MEIFAFQKELEPKDTEQVVACEYRFNFKILLNFCYQINFH